MLLYWYSHILKYLLCMHNIKFCINALVAIICPHICGLKLPLGIFIVIYFTWTSLLHWIILFYFTWIRPQCNSQTEIIESVDSCNKFVYSVQITPIHLVIISILHCVYYFAVYVRVCTVGYGWVYIYNNEWIKSI